MQSLRGWWRRTPARHATTKSAKRPLTLPEALYECLQGARKHWDEAVDICVRLNVDPRRADHQIRGMLSYPAGAPRIANVTVFTTVAAAVKEALEAGAAHAGGADLVEAVRDDSVEVERAVATPDALPLLSRVARQLGPRGLMPSPKTGTVGEDVRELVQFARVAVPFRVDPAGQVHAPVGKVSFGVPRLAQNVCALMERLLQLRPESVRKKYVMAAVLSRTQGPGVAVAPRALTDALLEMEMQRQAAANE